MAFNRYHQKSAGWREWVRTHRPELDACGIPEGVYSSQLRWLVCLEHGYDQPSGWRVSDLSRQSVDAFYDFLVREYGSSRSYYLCTFLPLENRLGRVEALARRVLARFPDATIERRPRGSGEPDLLVRCGARLYVFAYDGVEEAFGVGEAEDGAGFEAINEYFNANPDEAGAYLVQLLMSSSEPGSG